MNNKSDRQGDFFDEYHHDDSALVMNDGIEQPPIVNPYLSNIVRRRRAAMTVEDYMKGILEGNTIVLSQAITLVESSLPEHRDMAHELIVRCLEHSKRKESMRIGITGVPGAGKSTFIEAFGNLVTAKGHRLAVLAIDPSSEKTKGSILGDKTRMETLCNNPKAFIRPSPSAGSLGGVARKTRETILLCEAAGYDVVFIETVGVGQSETAVHSMSDFFLLILISGAGDDLQGIKRGVMEMSDLITVNKADGNNIDKANMARALYSNALHLFPPTESGWAPTALTASSVEKTGLEDIWAMMEKYFKLVKGNGYYWKRRLEQDRYWMYETINNSLRDMFYEDPSVAAALPDYERAVLDGKIDSFSAAGDYLAGDGDDDHDRVCQRGFGRALVRPAAGLAAEAGDGRLAAGPDTGLYRRLRSGVAVFARHHQHGSPGGCDDFIFGGRVVCDAGHDTAPGPDSLRRTLRACRRLRSSDGPDVPEAPYKSELRPGLRAS